MLRYIAPLDRFVADASLWLQGTSTMWMVVGISVALGVIVAVLARRRQRAQARVPHYRRVGSESPRRSTNR